MNFSLWITIHHFHCLINNIDSTVNSISRHKFGTLKILIHSEKYISSAGNQNYLYVPSRSFHFNVFSSRIIIVSNWIWLTYNASSTLSKQLMTYIVYYSQHYCRNFKMKYRSINSSNKIMIKMLFKLAALFITDFKFRLEFKGNSESTAADVKKIPNSI